MNKLTWNDEWQIIARTRAYNGVDITNLVKQLIETVNLLDEEYPKLSQRLNEIDSKADKVIKKNEQLVQNIQDMNKVAVSKDELNGYFEELLRAAE